MKIKSNFLPPQAEAELDRALARIIKGKTPEPMEDPYTGLPMNRAQRRQMMKKVAARVKQLEKGKNNDR